MKRKKITAWLLAVAMLVTMCPQSVSAQDADGSVTGTSVTEAEAEEETQQEAEETQEPEDKQESEEEQDSKESAVKEETSEPQSDTQEASETKENEEDAGLSLMSTDGDDPEDGNTDEDTDNDETNDEITYTQSIQVGDEEAADPTYASATVGDEVKLSVTVTTEEASEEATEEASDESSAEYTFAWYQTVDGENSEISESITNSDDKMTSCYTFEKEYSEDNPISYKCKILNSDEKLLSSAIFYIYANQTLSCSAYINEEDTTEAEVANGGTAELKVVATSVFTNEEKDLTYKWYKNDEEISGVVSNTYNVTKTGIQTEYYMCKVSDGNSNQSINFYIESGALKVTQTITVDEETYTNTDDENNSMSREVSWGAKVILTVDIDNEKASGYTPTYSWSYAEGDTEEGDTEVDDSDGAEDGSLTINSVEFASRTYDCTVTWTNATDGSDYTSESYSFDLQAKSLTYDVTVTINGENDENNDDENPTEYSTSAYYNDALVLAVQNAESSAITEDSEEGITYTWYNENPEWNEDAEEQNDTDTNSATYTTKKSAEEYDDYYCVVTDGYTTETIHFCVELLSSINAEPWIDEVRTNKASYATGDSVTLSLKNVTLRETDSDTDEETVDETTESEKFSYQWYLLDDSHEETAMENKIDSSCVIEKGTGCEQYSCKVTVNETQETCSYEFTLYSNSLSATAYVNDDPCDQSVQYGADGEEVYVDISFNEDGDAVLKVEASSTSENSNITYAWYASDSMGEGGDDLSTSERVKTAEDGTYSTCTAISTDEYSEISCYVSDGYDSEDIFFIYPYVSVITATQYIGEEQTNDKECSREEKNEGIELSLQDVKSTNEEDLTYQWYQCSYDDEREDWLYNEDAPLDDDDATGTITSDDNMVTYTIKSTGLGDECYCCVVSAGEESAEFYFTLEADSLKVSGFVGEEEDTYEAYIDVNAFEELSVSATSTYASEYTYQWYASTDDDTYEIVDGATSESYNATKVGYGAEYYYCKVSDGNDTERVYFTLYPNTLTVSKTTGTFSYSVGNTTNITVNVETSKEGATLSYKWYQYVGDEDRKLISGAHAATLSTTVQAGVSAYECVVTDGYATKSVQFDVEVSEDSSCDHNYTSTITKEATCTEAGVTTYTCSKCGAKYTEEIKATEHQYNDGIVTKEATCGAAGEKTYTCTVCKAMKTEPIAATGNHTWDEGVVTKAATHDTEGVMTYTCTVCGDTKNESIAKITDHIWDKGVVTKAATCKETGIKTYTCSVCGDTTTEDIPQSTEHTYDGGTVKTAATHETAGVMTYTCTVCGKTKDESIAIITDHIWNNGEVTTPATCTDTGVMTYTCTVDGCSEKSTAEIPATGHQNTKIINKKAATCLAAGYTGDTYCTDCETITDHGSAIAKLSPTISLTATSVKLKKKQKAAFSVYGLANGDSVVSATSSNTKVLTVSGSNGSYTLKAGKKTGKATFTIRLKSGLTRNVTVKVQKGKVKCTSIGNVSSITLKKGQSYKLNPTKNPYTCTDKFKYKSSKKKVATVSGSGVIKAKKKGKTKITISVGSKKKKITVTVK